MRADDVERINSERAFDNKRDGGQHDERTGINHWYAALGHCRGRMQALIRQYAEVQLARTIRRRSEAA